MSDNGIHALWHPFLRLVNLPNSNTSDPSAVILPYGKGSIGLIGTHPEADESWYDDENLTNPQGIQVSVALSSSDVHL